MLGVGSENCGLEVAPLPCPHGSCLCSCPCPCLGLLELVQAEESWIWQGRASTHSPEPRTRTFTCLGGSGEISDHTQQYSGAILGPLLRVSLLVPGGDRYSARDQWGGGG